MSLLKNIIKLAPLMPKTAVPCRAVNNYATPAREKVSTAEMMILGTGLVLAWGFVPVWVLVHIKEYNKNN